MLFLLDFLCDNLVHPCNTPARATSLLGFGFSRFTTMAANHFGSDYRPRRPGSTDTFPLSIAEAAALANDVELEMATDDQLHAAALIAAHSPYAQPEIRGRDWRTYLDPARRDRHRSLGRRPGLGAVRSATACAPSGAPSRRPVPSRRSDRPWRTTFPC